MAKKTWQQKLDIDHVPEVVKIEKPYAGIGAGTLVLVSTPREVDAFLKRIPEGRFVPPEEVRKRLAKKHGAETSCPLATGIFLRIASEAAYEKIAAGADPGEVTPFWRAVPPASSLAKKLACGPAFVKKMQLAEGIEA